MRRGQTLEFGYLDPYGVPEAGAVVRPRFQQGQRGKSAFIVTMTLDIESMTEQAESEGEDSWASEDQEWEGC